MTTNPNNIYFIDSRVTDIANLTGQLPSDAEWFLINAANDGLTQIQTVLADKTNLDAIHLITHGSPGSISLGNSVLNEGNINEFKVQLATVGQSLKSTGDLFIYGCDVGAGQVGQQFIQTIAELTSADVAASNDKTGSSLLGGNWKLEATYGVVEAPALDAQNAEVLLATAVSTSPTNQATIVTLNTSKGNIVIEVHPDVAPITVSNWLNYVEKGFYDDLLFHRVIPGFMIQGGGFSTGLIQKTGLDPAITLETQTGLLNERGTIAMARTNVANSATSQFFINLVDNAFLNYASATSPGYAVFGKVISGMDVVDAIATVPTQTVGGYQNVPITDVLITAADIIYAQDALTPATVDLNGNNAWPNEDDAYTISPDHYWQNTNHIKGYQHAQENPFWNAKLALTGGIQSFVIQSDKNASEFLNQAVQMDWRIGYHATDPITGKLTQGSAKTFAFGEMIVPQTLSVWGVSSNIQVKVSTIPRLNVDGTLLYDLKVESATGMPLSNEDMSRVLQQVGLEYRLGTQPASHDIALNIQVEVSGDGETYHPGMPSDLDVMALQFSNIKPEIEQASFNDRWIQLSTSQSGYLFDSLPDNFWAGNPSASLFNVTVNGQEVAVTQAIMKRGGLLLQLATPIPINAEVFVSYTDPVGDQILNVAQDWKGNDVHSTAQPVKATYFSGMKRTALAGAELGIAEPDSMDRYVTSDHLTFDSKLTVMSVNGQYLVAEIQDDYALNPSYDPMALPASFKSFEYSSRKHVASIHQNDFFKAFKVGDTFLIRDLFTYSNQAALAYLDDIVYGAHSINGLNAVEFPHSRITTTDGSDIGLSQNFGDFKFADDQYHLTEHNDQVTGGYGADQIYGLSGNDVLDGADGNDALYGGAGNDTLTGGPGNDVIHGGIGTDKAVFAGNASDYMVTVSTSSATVVDLVNGRDGTDVLTGIEQIAFADKVMNVSMASDASPPELVGISPILGSVGVPIDANFVGLFNEAVLTGQGCIRIKTLDGTVVQDLDVKSAGVLQSDNNHMVFNPPQNLQYQTSYVIEFDPGVVSDLAGNTAPASVWQYQFTTTSDPTLPHSPTISVTANDTELEPGRTTDLSFNLSEPSMDFTVSDVGVSGGTISKFSGSGTQYQATFTPNALATSGAVFVDSERFQDSTGNWNQDGGDQDNVVTLLLNQDLTPPTIALSASKSNLLGGESATINFTLSEVSTDFTLQDIGVTGGSLSNFTGSGKNYQATFTAAITAYSSGVFVDSERFTDASGLWNQDGGDLNNVVTFGPSELLPPTIAVSSNKSVLNNGESANITFTLSQEVSGFVASDVTAKGGTLSNFQGSGTSYSATFTANATATSGGVYVPSNKFTDLAGNLNKDGLESNNIATMAVRPVAQWLDGDITIKIKALVDGRDYLKIDNGLLGWEHFDHVVVGWWNGSSYVNEPTYVEILQNGMSVYSTTWTPIWPTLTPDPLRSYGLSSLLDLSQFGDFTKDASMSVDLMKARSSVQVVGAPSIQNDWAATLEFDDNPLGASDWYEVSLNFTKDKPQSNLSSTIGNASVTPPTIEISSSKLTLSSTEVESINFSLSEFSSDFSASDVTVMGGTLSNFQGDGKNYTATFTPNADTSSALLFVDSHKFSDTAGNMNADGADADNALALRIQPATNLSSPTLMSMSMAEPIDAFSINQSNVLSTGNGVINLGIEQGVNLNLLAPYTTKTGKTYYLLDANGDGVAGIADSLGHDVLDRIFNNGEDTFDTQPTGAVAGVDDARTWVKSGYTLVLPTTTEFIALRTELGNKFPEGWQPPDYDSPNFGTATRVGANVHNNVSFKGTTTYTNLYDGYYSGMIVLQVMGSNAAPVLSTPTAISYTDTAGNDTFVNKTGNLSASDADNDTLTYGVSGGTVANGFSSKQGSYGTLSVNASTGAYTFAPNDAAIEGIKATTSETFAVTVSDGKATSSANLSVNLTGANDTPTGAVTISGTPKVGQTLTAGNTLADAEGMGTVSYQWQADGVNITAATGASLTLTQAQLGKSISLVASYTDGGGTSERVVSASTPAVQSATLDLSPTISVTANDTELEPGQTSALTFTLSEPSLDFTALDVGVSGGVISNFSGSGTQYQATFTPNALATSGAVFVDSERFQDSTGNWNQDGGDQDNVVTLLLNQDLTPPTIALSTRKSNLVGGESITINFTLSEASTDFTLQDIGVSGGSLSNLTGSGKNYQARFTAANTVTSAGVFVDSERFTDASGLWNQDGGDLNNVVTFSVQPDITPPTISVSSNKSVLNNGESANITFTLSEAVSGFVASDVTAKGGTLSNFQGSGTSYSATFTANATATSGGVYVPSNKFTDLAGNLNKDGLESNNIATMMIRNGVLISPIVPPIYNVAPTIAITCNKTVMLYGDTAAVSFNLSTPSSNFTLDDVKVTGGTLGNFQGYGTYYTATFTPTFGAIAAVISVDSDKFTDAGGNLNKDGYEANNLITLLLSNGSGNGVLTDTMPPTVIVSTDKTSLSDTQTATINFALSEPSNDFSASDVTVVGGILSNFQGSGMSYSATFTPFSGSTDANVVVSTDKFSDAAGNLNKDGGEANNAVSMMVGNGGSTDITLPTIIVGSDKTTLSSTQTATLTFTLSEPSTDFSISDVVVLGGSLSNFQGSGTSYTATFTPLPSSTSALAWVSSDAFRDATGHYNNDGDDANNAISLTISSAFVDPMPPTIAISSDKTTLTNAQTAIISFNLSEPSNNFTSEDVSVVGGTLSNFQGSGTSYTATFTPNPGAVSAALFVTSGTFADQSGNVNLDGSDVNNALSFSIQSAVVQTTSLPSAPVPSLLSMQLDDPVDTFSINLSDVLLSGTTIGSTQTMLKIEGDANDVVNLSNLLDSGQNTGAWQANMSIQLDQHSYKYWTHSGNQNAVLLIEDSIQTVILM